MNNLEEMDKFPKTYSRLRLNHEEINNLNRLITNIEIESVIKNLSTKPRPDGFTGEFCKTFKEELTLILSKLFPTNEEDGRLPKSFYKASITLIPKSDTDTVRK